MGYSRHISMTKRAVCCAIYDRQVDLTKVSNHPGRSGPEGSNSSKSSIPLDHTNLLIHFLDGNEFNRHGGNENYMDTDMYARVPEEPSTPVGVGEPAGAEEPGAPTGAQQDGMPFVECFPSGTTGVPIHDMDQGVPVFQALCSNLGPDNICVKGFTPLCSTWVMMMDSGRLVF